MASPKPTVEVALKNVCGQLGEGPHWDDATQTLLFVDIDMKEVHRWTPSKDQTVSEKMTMSEQVGHVVPRAKGGYMIGLGRRFVEIRWGSDEVKATEDVENGQKTFRFNDGKCDAKGRLWGGTLSTIGEEFQEKAGSLYKLDLDRSISKEHTGLTISNGLAWTKDSTVMYLVDSDPRNVYAFDFDLEAGKLRNQRTVMTLPADSGLPADTNPDGMTIDTEGRLWIACWGGSAVIQVDPETGKTLQKIDIPAQQASSVCWGGKNLDELFITSARCLTEEELKRVPLSGSVFRVTGLGTRGYPAFVYQG